MLLREVLHGEASLLSSLRGILERAPDVLTRNVVCCCRCCSSETILFNALPRVLIVSKKPNVSHHVAVVSPANATRRVTTEMGARLRSPWNGNTRWEA